MKTFLAFLGTILKALFEKLYHFWHTQKSSSMLVKRKRKICIKSSAVSKANCAKLDDDKKEV